MTKKITMLIAGMAASSLFSQSFVNGNYTTGNISHNGSTAPNSLLWSECQNETGSPSETNGTAGFACFKNPVESYYLADDFTVPAGQNWDISQLNVFAYSNFGNAAPSIITVAIFNGSDPFGTPIFGDFTTNRFASASNPVAYRIFNSSIPAINNSVNQKKPVQKITANIGTTLPAGHYWVFWQLQVQSTFNHLLNDNINLYCPPITTSGIRTNANWNAKQYVVPTGYVNNALDGGYPFSVADVAQDFPFELVYNNTLGTGEVNRYDNSFRVFPNPANETLNILWPFSSKINEAVITDASGRMIKKVFINSKSVDVSDLKTGVYFLALKDDSQTKSLQFIKK